MIKRGFSAEQDRLFQAMKDHMEAKNHMVDWFLQFVRDEAVPLVLRVQAWEKMSGELLPVDGWISGNPFHGADENPYDYDFKGRGEVIYFDDLLDILVPETEEFEALGELDSNEEILEDIDQRFPLLKERFNAVFRNGKAGFTFDW